MLLTRQQMSRVKAEYVALLGLIFVPDGQGYGGSLQLGGDGGGGGLPGGGLHAKTS
jgi:hypothetical protein